MFDLMDYLPITMFAIIAGGVACFLLGVSYLRSKKNAYPEKLTPYECGFDSFDAPQKNARLRFDVKFYLVAILFIIFDLEIAFLFPWSIALKQIGWFGFWSMMMFLGVLTIGFIYEWKRGALDWH